MAGDHAFEVDAQIRPAMYSAKHDTCSIGIKDGAGEALSAADIVEGIEPDDADMLRTSVYALIQSSGSGLKFGDAVRERPYLVEVLDEYLLDVADLHASSDPIKHALYGRHSPMQREDEAHQEEHEGSKNRDHRPHMRGQKGIQAIHLRIPLT